MGVSYDPLTDLDGQAHVLMDADDGPEEGDLDHEATYHRLILAAFAAAVHTLDGTPPAETYNALLSAIGDWT